jgi:F-type H+-transporting ATPase subunit j
LTTTLQSFWMVSRARVEASKSRSSSEQGGPETPLSAFGPRNSHTPRQTPSASQSSPHPHPDVKKQHNTSSPSSMAFFGLRKWPTPVSSKFSIAGGGPMYCAHDCDGPSSGICDAHFAPILFTQVLRPLWPFFAASSVTYLLVCKMQDMGVRCASFCLTPNSANSRPPPPLFPLPCFPFCPFSRGVPQ